MFEIRGFAHVYGDVAHDRPETFAAGSLWPWAAQDRAFQLLSEHDYDFALASCGKGTLELFDTPAALGFRAWISLCHLDIVRAIGRGGMGVSIGEPKVLRASGARIDLAIIREVSLVEQPAFPSTSTWLAADDPREGRLELHDRQAEWLAGYQANMRPPPTGVDLIDGPNGYRAERKPRPQQPAAAPAPAQATLAGAWPWRSSAVCHRSATRWAILNRSFMAAR